eukprot:COSAG01_NODE_4286_length_5174_cov_3.830542_2_plen_53_part_00
MAFWCCRCEKSPTPHFAILYSINTVEIRIGEEFVRHQLLEDLSSQPMNSALS